MESFSFGERYRLELHWKNVMYEQDGICRVVGAYFSGPVLNEAQKINNNDNILLDFYSQYLVLVDGVYVAKFSWGEVIYGEAGSVSLKEAIITHDSQLNKVPKLMDTDYLVIDTRGHEVEMHPFNPLYKTYVVNIDTQLYKFGG